MLSRLRAIDGSAAIALAARLTDFARRVPSEPGSLGYEVSRAREDRRVFFIRECWSTQAEADRHIAQVAEDPDAKESSTLLAGPIETFTLEAAVSETTGTAAPSAADRTAS